MKIAPSILLLLATLSLGCHAPAPAKPADAAPADAAAEKAPASQPVVPTRGDPMHGPDKVETKTYQLNRQATETVVAAGPLPLLYWVDAGQSISVRDDAGKTVATVVTYGHGILRVADTGVYLGEDQLSTGRLSPGQYKIVIAAQSAGEIRQEYRNRTLVPQQP